MNSSDFDSARSSPLELGWEQHVFLVFGVRGKREAPP